MATGRIHDIVIFGATGFTGRLVAEHLLEQYGVGRDVKWAMAARSEGKLRAAREGLGSDAHEVPLIVADARDAEATRRLVGQTKVVCSAIGPSSGKAEPLAAACAEQGTHYCDLAGEPQYQRKIIDACDEKAKQTGARLVSCCGYISVPSDIGNLLVNEEMQRKAGGPCESVKGVCISMNGPFSGGTWHTILNTVREIVSDQAAKEANVHPYGINPRSGMDGSDVGDQVAPRYDDDLKSWTTIYLLGGLNNRIVRRSHALMGYPYGKEFTYSECLKTFGGPLGMMKAAGETAGGGVFQVMASIPPTRALLGALLPGPGKGPSKKKQLAGDFEHLMIGRRGERRAYCRVKGRRDPGYGATARIVGQCASALALDELDGGGGVLTPATAFGKKILPRLEKNAEVVFSIE